jgi:hypothetical protein
VKTLDEWNYHQPPEPEPEQPEPVVLPIAKVITYFGEQMLLSCDAKCNKAWGINHRPRRQLSEEDDDYVYLADHATGIAPIDPGTYEGGHAKPTLPEDRLNKWCCRECERSVLTELSKLSQVRAITYNFEKPKPNMPQGAR